LRLRREKPELFRAGDYLPLLATGEHADHLVAFARRLGDDAVVAVAPRLRASLPDGGTTAGAWGDTALSLAELPTGRYRNVLDGAEYDAPGEIPAGRLLRDFPVAMLVRTAR
ncbi:MAG TPA: hypothetical protein VFI96_02280, partial [Longimicrobiaceae bacterium]|nr:hypothetical protein [Longimicrobiaceae bacterium]